MTGVTEPIATGTPGAETIPIDLMAIPHWAVVNAVRYALDHPWEECNTIATCDWLVGRWRLLPAHVRGIVRAEVEDTWPFVGRVTAAFRREWGRVRELWASTG